MKESGFPGSDGKVSVYNMGDQGSIPGLGRSPGEGNGNPLQYYWLENPMDRGAAKSRTRLSVIRELRGLQITSRQTSLPTSPTHQLITLPASSPEVGGNENGQTVPGAKGGL